MTTVTLDRNIKVKSLSLRTTYIHALESQTNRRNLKANLNNYCTHSSVNNNTVQYNSVIIRNLKKKT